MVEYCSKLNKDFPYDESSNFVAIGCKCLSNKNTYEEMDNCKHQEMLYDPHLTSYLQKSISNENDISEKRINSVKNALNEKDYENICNLQLLKFYNPEDYHDLGYKDNIDDKNNKKEKYKKNEINEKDGKDEKNDIDSISEKVEENEKDEKDYIDDLDEKDDKFDIFINKFKNESYLININFIILLFQLIINFNL